MRTEYEISLTKGYRGIVVAAVVLSSLGLDSAFAQTPVRITLDQAIDLAVKHNHTLQAARTTIQQSQAAEITANLRPNPTFFTDWEYLPVLTRPQGETLAEYLQASTEADMGLSYLIERGKKRQARLQAAKNVTAVTRAQVADNERGAQFLVTVPAFLLAEANLGLLGLGIPEPIPSLGGLLRELENLPGAVAHPWMFVPALLLFTVVGAFHLLVSADKYSV